MKMTDYCRGMDKLTPGDQLRERILALSAPAGRRAASPRRVLRWALAAALALVCLFSAALAVSPELRGAVLSFFRMEEREQLPDPSPAPEGPAVSQAEIGTLAKAQYIQMEGYQTLSGDLLRDLTWSEDGRTLEEAKFREVRDSELVPVEVELHTQALDVSQGGVRYQGELYWYLRKGRLYAFKGSPFGVDTQPEDQWQIRTLPGRTDAILLLVSQGWQMERTETTLLYHLDTGEAEELLAGVDSEVMAQSDGAIWSPGGRRALITGRASAEYPDGREWLYDRESGVLTDVADLGGVGADMAVFVGDDTLILRNYTEGEEGESLECWAYHIPSGQATQTLPQSPCYRERDEAPWGVIPFYGGWCMEVSRDGAACLIDLTTGTRRELENFVFQKNMNFWLNPSGDKLLYYAKEPGTEGFGISQLGVIDLEQMTFIAFDREGYENFREGNIVWEDDNTVSIHADAREDGTQYLIVYQF